MRTSWIVALVMVAVAVGCADRTPTDAEASASSSQDPQGALAAVSTPAAPIELLMLSGRHQFTDAAAARIRFKHKGRPWDAVNYDPTRMAVAKITVQPGARFPWHTHPGPVFVAIKRGTLVYVRADDCVERNYPTGTGLVDPGNNVHYAFNPTKRETVLIATFFGVPAEGPLTIPVEAATATELDGKCGVAPAASHTH